MAVGAEKYPRCKLRAVELLRLSGVTVVRATGPRREDRKSRFPFRPVALSRKARDQGSVQERSSLWHTHPEPEPTPSGLDLGSMTECFSKSRHEHGAFVKVIVGNGRDEGWLWVFTTKTIISHWTQCRPSHRILKKLDLDCRWLMNG